MTSPPKLPYLIPWETLYDGLRLLYPLEHQACRWVFAMWARTMSDEWPDDEPWWSFRFDPDEPSNVWPTRAR